MSGWDQFVQEERERCERRRARVLAQPEVARRLCLPPLSLTTPENWTGYVPPPQYAGKPNDSPVRKQLLALLEAVLEAENAANAARTGA